MPGLVLGVDGGNTKSVALVADAEGRVIGSARAGCGDMYGTGPEAALAELDRAIDGALLAAGASRDDIAGAGLSLAGADWPEDYAFLRAQIASRFPTLDAIVLVNDGLGALRAGTPDGVGVSVVCGTGSAIGARSADGRTWHASFWGEDFGAVTMGQRAVRAIVRAELGLDPPTALATRALGALEATSVEELLHAVTRREGRAAPLLAKLAPHVLDAAEAGDAAALRIATDAGTILGSYADVAARQVGLTDGPFTLVLAGGVFRHPSTVLRAAIHAVIPSGRPIRAEFEPAVGALLLAFDQLGWHVDPTLLRSTHPSPELFAA